MTKRQRMDRWFVELWDKRRWAIIDEMVHPECRIWGLPGSKHGPAGFKPFVEMFGGAFEKVSVTIDESIEQDDRIAIRCSCHAITHDGVKHDFTGGGMVRFDGDGKIIEAWNQFDFMSLLGSMGRIPATAFLDGLAAAAAMRR